MKLLKVSRNNLKETDSVLPLFIDFLMTGAVCVFECLSGNLVLQEFFQAINFHFTWTTKHQPSRNLDSSTQPFSVTFTASLLFQSPLHI